LGYWLIDFSLAAAGRNEEALAYAWKTIAIREKSVSAQPNNLRLLAELANVYRDAGKLLMVLGRTQAARDPYRKCLDTRLKLALAVPRDTTNRAGVGGALFDQALTGEDVDPQLADIGERVRRLAAAGQFREDEAVFVGAIRRELAYLYVSSARDQFYSGHPDRAVAEAQKAQAVAPSYPYAPLWLHVFRWRSGEDDSAEFSKNTEKMDKSEWPWPIVAFLRGISDAAALRTAAMTMGDEDDRAGQVCEVDFFIGLDGALRDKPTEARPLLQLAASKCPRDFIAYGAAVAELKRLDALNAPQARQ
jgi:tetratricopeptide (TPR) repeat protein